MIELAERIIVDPEIMVGKPIVRGTRISVAMIIGLLADGWTEDDVLRNHPNLRHEDIIACLNYAHDVIAGESIYPTAA
jgi:uncharacterized protein (DUF433 family)